MSISCWGESPSYLSFVSAGTTALLGCAFVVAIRYLRVKCGTRTGLIRRDTIVNAQRPRFSLRALSYPQAAVPSAEADSEQEINGYDAGLKASSTQLVRFKAGSTQLVRPKASSTQLVRPKAALPNPFDPRPALPNSFDLRPALPNPFDLRPALLNSFDLRPALPKPFDPRPALPNSFDPKPALPNVAVTKAAPPHPRHALLKATLPRPLYPETSRHSSRYTGSRTP